MTINKKIDAYSKYIFDEICEENNWNDKNVENLSDMAFISIIGTKDVQKYHIEEDEEHWFKRNHSNVLNLEFDDVTEDIIWGDDYKAYAITDEQAKQIFDFIFANKGKTILIHCRAGISRSYAIAYWCVNNLEEYKNVELDYGTPNVEVLRKLNRILWGNHFE